MHDPQRDPFFEGLIAAIRDGYDAIARRHVVDTRDVFAKYGLDRDTPIAFRERPGRPSRDRPRS
jgi:hypothetical protein